MRSTAGSIEEGWIDWIRGKLSKNDTMKNKIDGNAAPQPSFDSLRRTWTKQGSMTIRTGGCFIFIILLFGLRALLYPSGPSSKRILVEGREPLKVLAEVRRHTATRAPTDVSNSVKSIENPGDVTAIVLHWKRTANVVVIVSDLCRYDFIKEVVVWNNNPTVRLSQEVSSFLIRK